MAGQDPMQHISVARVQTRLKERGLGGERPSPTKIEMKGKSFLKTKKNRIYFLGLLIFSFVGLFVSLGFVNPEQARADFTDVTTGSLVGVSGNAVWGDYDSDGDLDLYVTKHLFRNDGDGNFTDVAAGTSLGNTGAVNGAVWGDYDNDGDLDLYLATESGANKLFRNDGDGNFTDVAAGTALADTGKGNGVAWGDYDNDGDLDLYLANWQSSNKLFRNEGDDNFTVVWNHRSGPDQSVSWADFDNDGNLDILVTALAGTPNELYQNDGLGNFTNIASGVLASTGNHTRGLACGDYDNDGDMDVFYANDGQSEQLLRNDGNANFSDASASLPFSEGTSGYGSWSDYDNDGDLDLYVGGNLYPNSGDGNFAAGTPLPDPDGGVWGDYDNDGDLDIYGSGKLMRNNQDDNNFLFVRPLDAAGNFNQYGAQVRLYIAGTSTLVGLRQTDGGISRYTQSAVDVHFGVNGTGSYDIDVRFPGGIIVDKNMNPLLENVSPLNVRYVEVRQNGDVNIVTSGNIIRVPADQPTIQAGIDVASDGGTVLVADGIYTGEGNKNLDFKGKAITVTSENGAANCVIDCEGDGRGFYFHSGETEESLVKGFTIKDGGNVWTGGGISCENNSSPIIDSNIITGCIAGGGGGGINCTNSSPKIVNNTIIGNSTDSGGGIWCYESYPQVINNIISGNSTTNSGGGIGTYNCSPTIVNNTITGNSATNGGGGITVNDFTPMVKNTILWGNTGGQIRIISGSINITYSCIQGGWSGTGNIDVDPMFADAGNGNYHLKLGSPCIDTADPTSDYSNEPEPNGGRINMGAYGNTPEATISQSYSGPIWYVSTEGDDDNNGSEENPFATIQRGIDAASDGDTVLVADGTYTSGGNKNLSLGNRSITVTSHNGAKNTIIDCEGTGEAFSFNSDTTGEIRGFTIKNAGGKGIYFARNISIDVVIDKNIITLCPTAISRDNYVSGSLTITNCLIAKNGLSNPTWRTGGIDICSGSNTIVNTTIVENDAVGCGGGFYAEHCSTTVKNCILWGNTVGGNLKQIFLYSGASVSFTYCDIQGGWSGTDNIDAEPLFVGAAISDYRLQDGSPCINTGTTEGAPTDDVEGNPRDELPDMGVYEYLGVISLAVDAGLDQSICHPNNGGEVHLGGTPTARGGTPSYTYSWTPATGLDNPNIANPRATPTTTTTYAVAVTDSSETPQEESDSVTVTVHPELVADAGEDKIVAKGSSVGIGGEPTASGGTVPYTYSWTPTLGLDNPNIANPTANPNDTATYTVTVTDDNGCQNTDEMTVEVGIGPQIASVTEDTDGVTKTVGDVITVAVTQAEDSIKAIEGKFSIGDAIVDKPLTETSPRIWTGEYTVEKGDMVNEQPVTASLKSDGGIWTTPPVASETKVTIDTIAVINEVTVSPTTPVGIGSKITVTAVGEASAQSVTFSIAGVPNATDKPMTESTPGNYTNSYTVLNGDNAKNATVTVTTKDPIGNIDSKESPDKATLDGVNPTVENPTATPKGIIPDGNDTSLLTVSVTDAASGVDSVKIGLSPVNGQPQQPMYDDGTNGDVTDGDGIYSISITVAPGTDEGKYDLAVTATDSVGNINSSVLIPLYVDNTPPTVTDANAAPPTVPCGGYKSLLTAKVTDLPLDEHYKPIVTINLNAIGGNANQPMFDDGTNGDEVASDSIYSYEITTNCSMPHASTNKLAACSTAASASDGTCNTYQTYQLPITVTDIAGHQKSVDVELTVSFGQPVAEIDYPAENACLRGEVCITGTAEGCSEVLNSWILRRAYKGGPFIDIGSGTEPVSKATLKCWDTTKESDGDYTLKLIVYTGEQHNETPGMVTVTVDNTPPQPSITIGENNHTKSNTSISVSGETEAGSTVDSATLVGLGETQADIKDVTSDITIDATGKISGMFTVGDLSNYSDIKVKLCLRDCAGNEGCGFSNTLMVDDELPTVRILTPANCAYFNRLPIPIAGEAQDSISGVAEVKINGLYSAELLPVDDTTTNWKLDYYPPGEGVYIIRVGVYDNAGNFFESPDTIKITYSTGSLAANISSPSDNNEVSCVVSVYGLVDDADADPIDLQWELRAITGTVEDTCSDAPCTGKVIASGDTPVYGGLLTQWDTRNLWEGPYTLCLTVKNNLTSVHVRRTNIIVVEKPCVLYGDVNEDGKITAEDASLVLRTVVGFVTLNETQRQAADVTGDGNVTALDAATILQYTVGIIPTLPLQK